MRTDTVPTTSRRKEKKKLHGHTGISTSLNNGVLKNVNGNGYIGQLGYRQRIDVLDVGRVGAGCDELIYLEVPMLRSENYELQSRYSDKLHITYKALT